MEPITQPQLIAFNTLIHKLGLMNHKADIVGGATNGRSESSKDLYSHEARDLIMQLNDQLKSQDTNAAGTRKMIGKIFYYAHEMGWTKLNAEGKRVADGKSVDTWMVSHSYLKKKLNQYKYNELPKLVSQFEQVYKHHLNKF